jgi:hypothetical protein
MIIIILIILLIVVYPHYNYCHYGHDNLLIKKINPSLFNTGDLLLFRYETPVFYKAKNGFNISSYFGKAIQTSLTYYSQKLPYTHAAIVYDNKFWHMSSDPYYDVVDNKVKIAEPVLCSLDDLDSYRGTVYLHKLKKAPYEVPLSEVRQKIANKNIKLQGNVCIGFFTCGLKLFESANHSCLDFVNIIQYYLGIRNVCKKTNDIHSILTDSYDKNPILLDNAWYKYRFKN